MWLHSIYLIFFLKWMNIKKEHYPSLIMITPRRNHLMPKRLLYKKVWYLVKDSGELPTRSSSPLLFPMYLWEFHKCVVNKQTLTYMSGEIIEAAHHNENHNCHFELGGHLIWSKKNNNNNNIETDYFHSVVSVKYIIPHACFLCKSFERKQ